MSNTKKDSKSETKSIAKNYKDCSAIVVCGIFEETKELGMDTYTMKLPPENSRKFKGLEEAIKLNNEMTIDVLTFDKIVDKQGKLQARVDSKTKKVLSGNVNYSKKVKGKMPDSKTASKKTETKQRAPKEDSKYQPTEVFTGGGR